VSTATRSAASPRRGGPGRQPQRLRRPGLRPRTSWLRRLRSVRCLAPLTCQETVDYEITSFVGEGRIFTPPLPTRTGHSRNDISRSFEETSRHDHGEHRQGTDGSGESGGSGAGGWIFRTFRSPVAFHLVCESAGRRASSEVKPVVESSPCLDRVVRGAVTACTEGLCVDWC
jgi:hypothetical protein